MIDSEKEASKQMQAFLKVKNSSDVIINILLVALLPAICEEVFFRGCLQRILIYAFKSPWTGIIVTAALFSAFHMQFEGFLPRMFLGALLGAPDPLREIGVAAAWHEDHDVLAATVELGVRGLGRCRHGRHAEGEPGERAERGRGIGDGVRRPAFSRISCPFHWTFAPVFFER